MSEKVVGMTVKQIIDADPCYKYTRERLEQLRREVCGRRRIITARDIARAPIPAVDKLWLILRPDYIAERDLHEIAIWCWEEIARPIWEKYYSDDKRPHQAVETKRRWLNGEASDEELVAAREAALAACESARVAATEAREAREAAFAAWEAARVAAGASACESAREAAGASALAAAGASAWEAAGEAAGEAARAADREKTLTFSLTKVRNR